MEGQTQRSRVCMCLECRGEEREQTVDTRKQTKADGRGLEICDSAERERRILHSLGTEENNGLIEGVFLFDLQLKH